MKRKITFKLIVMLVTASILLSSTGLSAMLAEAQGVDETTTSTTNDNSTTEATKTTDPNVKTEGGKLTKAGPTVAAEGGALRAVTQGDVPWMGDGTSENPYQLWNVDDFLAISADNFVFLNDTTKSNKYFVLEDDIDLTSLTIDNFKAYAGFNASLICLDPLLASPNVFINLDGGINKHKIYNLNINNSSKDSCAIFGYLNSRSVIKNIVFENCKQTVTYNPAAISAVVAVQNAGLIDNCTFNNMTLDMSSIAGTVTSETVKFNPGLSNEHIVYVGNSAVVGDNLGTIQNCDFSDIDISVYYRMYVGAIAGQNRGSITGINGSEVAITSTYSNPSTYIGGIAGRNLSGAILSGCSINLPGTGSVQVNSFTYGNMVGGISGSNAGTVADCIVSGKVLSSGSRDNLNDTLNGTRYDIKGCDGSTTVSNIYGGIAGENTGAINNCSAENIGMFSADSSSNYVIYGGVAGKTSNNISNSFASGKESGGNGVATGYYVGGIAGSVISATTISNCYALVSLSEYTECGGAIVGAGGEYSTLTSCYWSSNVSGRSVSELKGMDNHDIQRNITALCVTPNTENPVQIWKSQFSHSWGSIAGEDIKIDYINSTSAFSVSNSKFSIAENSDSITVTGGSESGSSGKIYYNLSIKLPVGIGALPREGEPAQRTVKQQLSIDTVVSSQANVENPIVSPANPIKITNANETAYLQSMNYSNFELAADITLPAGWNADLFYGTLAGNGHTITLSKPLFSKIYGARDNTAPEGANEAANTALGYVHNFNLYLTAPIRMGVMGFVVSATVKNVKLTGDSNAVLNPALSEKGAFIDSLLGNSYIYGCFTDVGVNIANYNIDNFAGLIGVIDADTATVDNCGSNSSVSCIVAGNNKIPTAIASLIGNIKKNAGIVKNSYCGGFVQKYGNIAVGKKADGIALQNIYWSVNNADKSQQATINPTDDPKTGTTEWTFAESTGYVSTDGGYINIALPQSIGALANSQTSDFSFTLTYPDNAPQNIAVGDLVISNGRLKVQIKKSSQEHVLDKTELTITHNPSGLKARIYITDGLSKDENNYYLIRTAADLQNFCENAYHYKLDVNGNLVAGSESGYLTDSNLQVKLMADIDMRNYSFTPIGKYNSLKLTAPDTKPFTGKFIGGDKPGGGKYTISNLSISGGGYVGIFAYANNATISNFNVDNLTINATGQYAGGIIAYGSGCTVSNIEITNSKVQSTYSSGQYSYTGGVIGAFATGSSVSSISGISINNLSVLVGTIANNVFTPASGNSGGVVGYIPAITVDIKDINATDLNVKGAESIGGVVGNMTTGATTYVTIEDISLIASGNNGTPTISGTGYVGGIVGKTLGSDTAASRIYDCNVNGISITNTGTVTSDTAPSGATGGIAGWFSGIITGDNPTTTENETIQVTSCNITGVCAGGILGKAYTFNNKTIDLTVTGCTVGGTTNINALSNTNNTHSAGGIVSTCGNSGSTSISNCNISNCYVKSSVAINGGKYSGGILASVLGYISSTATTTNTALKIDSCQSFATILTTATSSYSGGIIGNQACQINKTKILNCVFGGSLTAVSAVGGIVGYIPGQPAFVLQNAENKPFITFSYVTASKISVSSGSNCGKIIGLVGSSPSAAITNDNIAQAINVVVFSSYPQNINAYGQNYICNYENARYSWDDISRPYDEYTTNLTPNITVSYYQSGQTTAISLTNDAPYTISLDQQGSKYLPVTNSHLGTFIMNSDWTAMNGKISVDSTTATSITFHALRTTASSGIIADYQYYDSSKPENPYYYLYATDTPQKLSFKACIPVTCSGIGYNWHGSGTESDPYQIWNVDDFDEMRNKVTWNDLDSDTQKDAGEFSFNGYFKLMNDINFTTDDFSTSGDFYNNGKLFIPIKAVDPLNTTTVLPFSGYFDGNGKTISGLKINNTGSTATYTGLFEQTAGATFNNLTIQDAVITGDTVYSTYGGILVANAVSTVFSGVTVTGSSLSKVYNYAGGIVGLATGSTVSGSSVNATSVTSQPSGSAGGIAGAFGGTIGPVTASGYDVQVINSTIKAGNAGGIIGYNNISISSIKIQHTLVSGGTVTSSATADGYAAGGILGFAIGSDSNTAVITYCKVASGTVVTGISGTETTTTNTVGGIVGRLGTSAYVGPKLDMDNTSSYASVIATGAATGTSDAGGIIGRLADALKVKISNGVAGGSVSGSRYVGGIIGYIEGTTLSLALSNATNSLVSNFVVSSDISTTGTQIGLVLGFADSTLFPAVTAPATDYTVSTFSNIKYSSYQYIPGRLYIGNSVINNMSAPNFTAKIFDLNKGYKDTWSQTYKGLGYIKDEKTDFSFSVVLGVESITLGNNIILPVLPNYSIKSGGTFDNFTDTAEINFQLKDITAYTTGTPPQKLIDYDSGTHTISKTSGADGSSSLIFEYTNGLKLALKLVAYNDLYGSGTVDDPYQILNTNQLGLIRTFPTNHFIQTANLTFTDADYFHDVNGVLKDGPFYNNGYLWSPLQGDNASTYFTGSYDGQGLTITGLRIARSTVIDGSQDYVGFFRKIDSGARVTNITFINANVAGADHVGVLAGGVTGYYRYTEKVGGIDVTRYKAMVEGVTVQNSVVTSSKSNASISAPSLAGGLVGYENNTSNGLSEANLLNCSVNSTTVTTASANYTAAGGVAGAVQSIKGCSANNVTVNAYYYAGGIAGVLNTVVLSTKVNIDSCSVLSSNGVSQISTKSSVSTSAAGGIVGFTNAMAQTVVNKCAVNTGTIIQSTSGTAGGIMGIVYGVSEYMENKIYGSENYATVIGGFDAGGILGGIKGSAVKLSNILFDGCVGAGTVKSTTTGSGSAGGIIGSVSGSAFTTTTYFPPSFIKNCISSAFLTVSNSFKGKLVGNCTSLYPIANPANYDTLYSNITPENRSTQFPTIFATLFSNNIVSSYPQDIDAFGTDAEYGSKMNALLKTSQNILYTDIMKCKQTTGDPVNALLVKNGGEYLPIAIATFDSAHPNQAVTTNFDVKISVYNGTAPIDLVEAESYQPFSNYDYDYALQVLSVQATTNAEVSSNLVVNPDLSKTLHVSVTQHSKQAGQLEVSIGCGLKIAVPLLAFEITGTGTQANPFQIANANHLNLLNYLPDAYYKQVADININPDDYIATGTGDDRVIGALYNEGSIFEGKGFKPIGYDSDLTDGFQGQPFTGSYDGQNYKITGLYTDGITEVSINGKKDGMRYIGLFGYVTGTSNKNAVLKNIHIELMENGYSTTSGADNRYGISGKQYVGGLAGKCSSTVTISNCSVAKGTVAGKQMVGGLIGESHASISNCFTTCDVLGAGNSIVNSSGDAGGLIGYVNNDTTSKITISGCFATGSIYSGYLHAGGFVGRVNSSIFMNPALEITDSFFTGDIKAGGTAPTAILVGTGTSTPGNVNGNNIYVAGTNTSFNGAMVPLASQGGTKTNIYYDNLTLALTNTTQGTATTTGDITNGTLPAGFSSSVWTAANGSYPRLNMTNDYSNAFCALATVPMQLDSKEVVEDSVTGNILENSLDGMIYPVKIPDKVNGASIDLSSSKLEYHATTVPYPADYDPTLTGNGSDRDTDLLFGPSVNNTRTIYRNIFVTNTYPASSLDLLYVQYGELWYDCKTPIITMSATVNGVLVSRSMKLPLETAANTYYIATERQLRAIGNANEVSNTKFYPFAFAVDASNSSASSSKFILTANINLRGDISGSEFEPISILKGSFDGGGYTISKLKISKTAQDLTSDNVGMFRNLAGVSSSSMATVKNINFEDVWVTGRNNVGVIAGSTSAASSIINCKIYSSGTQSVTCFVTGNNSVGGLVGSAQGFIGGDKSALQCSSAVNVSGVNVVGGFVGSYAGTSSSTIQNCFATGNVTGTITSTGSSYGIGGFAGVVTGGLIQLAFSSGNVYVNSIDDFIDNPKIIGVGGFAGTTSTSSVATIKSSFASGDVKVEGIGRLKMTTANAGNLMFGVGGLVGTNQSPVTSCYSTSSVYAEFTSDEVLGTTGAKVGAGVGGVVGVGLSAVTDAYSSGSVLRDIPPTVPDDTAISNTYFKSALGGVIGTINGLDPTGFSQLYFDLWNSGYGTSLKAIGCSVGSYDSEFVRSLTTDQMTYASPLLKLNTNTWTFNNGAYPCLQSLVSADVSSYVRYAAVLSVISAFLDIRDTSARSGNGITMAITTPNSISVSGTVYNLNWSRANDSEVYYMSSVSQDGTTSKFVPVRTSNAKQKLSLNVTVKDNTSTTEDESKFASRNFAKPCAQMCGTEAEPYLIATKTDFQHIGLSASDIADAKNIGFTNFYDTWFSPITIDSSGICTNLTGKVYFRLLSDIDMTRDVVYNFNTANEFVDVTIHNPDASTPQDDNHNIPYLLNETYPNNIVFQGISLDGRDYTVKNFKAVSTETYTAKPLFDRLSFRSDIKDIAFSDLTIDTGASTGGTALVGQNNGKIDGLIINSGSIKAGSNVAAIAAINDDSDIRVDDPLTGNINESQQMGIITNCVVGAPLSDSTVKTTTVTGNAVVGGIAAVNGARGTITNCAFADGSEVRADAASSTANAGGIAGINNGNINNCFTMGKATATNGGTTIGGVVGANNLGGIISGAYSRTNVSGTAAGSDNIGGFAGTNAGTIINAYSAGMVTLPATFTQTGIFCGTNTGTLTDVVADKAMSGSSTAKLLINSTLTERLISMTCFSSTGTASSYFAQTNASSYPQLKSITGLDVSGSSVPMKYKLLMGYSSVSVATVNTKYSQYINTLATSSANALSTIPAGTSFLSAVTWQTDNASVITVAGTTGSTANVPAKLTPKLTITLSTEKSVIAALPIDIKVGDQNKNFSGGVGSLASPYLINSVDSFNSLAYYGPDSEIYYKLISDINYGGGCPALPIIEFSGNLNGQNASQNHVIYDMTIGNNTGLFGIINKAAGSSSDSCKVYNLGLVGVKVINASAADSVGLLAGRAQGATVTNCYAIGEINLAAKDVGGLIGMVSPNTTVTGCLTSGKFINTSTDSASSVGGIAGYADSTTTNGINGCFSSAYVKGIAGKIGGIVGQLVNNSKASGNVFAGMVLDTALAGGSTAPAAGAAIGNIAGSKDASSTITSSYFDKQVSLIADANATPKFTGELSKAVSGAWAANVNTGSYAIPANLYNSSARFAAGIAFATMPVKFLLGTAAGSTLNFSNVSIPGSSNGDSVVTSMNTDIFEQIGSSPTVISVKHSIALSNKFTGVTVSLDTIATGANYNNMSNPIQRYYEPRLNRIVTVSYFLTDSSSSLAGKTVAVQLKNKNVFAGETLTYSSDAFTVVGSDSSVFEDLVVTSGGIFAGGELPAGYSYQITAKDQSGNDLTVTTDKERGAYIALQDATTQIKLSYTIIRYSPWGVHKFWDSLVDTLVSG